MERAHTVYPFPLSVKEERLSQGSYGNAVECVMWHLAGTTGRVVDISCLQVARGDNQEALVLQVQLGCSQGSRARADMVPPE